MLTQSIIFDQKRCVNGFFTLSALGQSFYLISIMFSLKVRMPKSSSLVRNYSGTICVLQSRMRILY
ncbi:hypothetical protein BWR59_06240 [Pseudomonas sp. Bc-h]|nr:hypothetical protein BWR59_06240 [Pseudomonas sp. Bc-h]